MELPEVTEKSEAEIDAIIKAIKDSSLPENTRSFVIKCIELAIWVPQAIQRKNISLHRLRTLIFGKGYKKSTPHNKKDLSEQKNNHENHTCDGAEETQDDDVVSTDEVKAETVETLNENDSLEPKKKKGHGRMPHNVYDDCKEVTIESPLKVGDPCPTDCGGRLSSFKPGTFVRIYGNNLVEKIRYTVKKFRCNLCGDVFKPDIPPEVGSEKYDVTFKSMLALQKYYVAVPFYRQETFQKMLGFPLPDSTQWDLIEQLAGSCYAPFNELKVLAANGKLIHNDDTKLRILEVIQRIKRGGAGERLGMFTTGIIAKSCGHEIALFLNGTQYAGENLADILKHRDPTKDEIIQMCDGLNQNIPKSFATIVCHCLSHGFRKFDELKDYFPEECIYIMKLFGRVYENDEKTHSMREHERLAYHQQHSQSVMNDLKQYMGALLDERRVEPNSELGKAITYMQKRWVQMTRFLSVAGAPIDNNVVERALKIAIRNRKAAYFYKTEYSAEIGGMITSLIYTCALAGANPFDYLTELQRHQDQVCKTPSQWLPWNYRETLQSLELAPIKLDAAKGQGLSPPEDLPVAA